MPTRGDQDRTEAPTQKRREEARKRGQVARSREVPSAMVLLASAGFLSIAGGSISSSAMASFSDLISNSFAMELTPEGLSALFMDFMSTSASIAGPFVGLMVLVVIGANLAQIGFLSAPEALSPNWARINPVEGLRRILSLNSMVELLKGLIKLAIVAWVLWRSVMEEWEILQALGNASPWSVAREMSGGIVRIGLRAGMVVAALALLDYLYQRWEHERSLRMTKEEVKEEFKQREGDPKVRARIRQRQREMARRRMMAEVPKADVVITNPLHLAIALKYDKAKMSAPIVVAKGAGYLAERIKEIARRHSVEIVENKPLAQALYKMVDVGSQIPVELYRAVAEVLAYVYRKRSEKSRGSEG